MGSFSGSAQVDEGIQDIKPVPRHGLRDYGVSQSRETAPVVAVVGQMVYSHEHVEAKPGSDLWQTGCGLSCLPQLDIGPPNDGHKQSEGEELQEIIQWRLASLEVGSGWIFALEGTDQDILQAPCPPLFI